VLLQGCSSLSPSIRYEYADRLATEKNWQKLTIDTTLFPIQSYVSPIQSGELLILYIEGDGLAWISKTKVSSNPTPLNPMALKLALKDKGNVAYLARPCQYLQNELCLKKYWTSDRFSPDVVSSMNQAVTYIKDSVGATELVLVGYSGGGAIAALISARRDDVVKLITVAGNLDHLFWTKLQGISALTGSLNPADYWRDLFMIPQLHLVGEEDKAVPLAVARSYQAVFPDSHKPIIKIIPAYSHQCCWQDNWPELIN
jgi:hypothetical protein